MKLGIGWDRPSDARQGVRDLLSVNEELLKIPKEVSDMICFQKDKLCGSVENSLDGEAGDKEIRKPLQPSSESCWPHGE